MPQDAYFGAQFLVHLVGFLAGGLESKRESSNEGVRLCGRVFKT